MGSTRIENSEDSQRRLPHTPYRSLRQSQAPPQQALLRKRYQACRIGTRIRGLRQHHVIASDLTLESQLALQPPYRWMEEEQCMQDFLRKVRPIVPAL